MSPTDTAQAAWQTLRQQLQLELPKATFEERLQAARALGFADGVFTLGVEDAYTRAWLESRLGRTLANQLQGILNQPVEVQFVLTTREGEVAPIPDLAADPAAAWAAAQTHVRAALTDPELAAALDQAHFLAFYDQRYIVSLPTVAACQELTPRLTPPLTRTLQELTQSSEVELQWVAAPLNGASAPKPEARSEAAEPVTPGRDSTAAEILIQPLRTSLRAILTRPKSVLVVSAYLLRWLPYLGVDQGWFLLAMRQAFYRTYGEKVQGGNCGQTFTVNRQQIARWSGLGDRKVWALLKSLEPPHDPGNFLAWFMQGTPSAPGHPKVYTFRADMPLTPGDAAALSTWLLDHGLQDDPLATLQAALDLQPQDLLPFPPTPVTSEARTFPPAPQSVVEVVLATAGLPPTDPRYLPLKKLAAALEQHLQSPADNLLITHYFMLEWLRKLGRVAGWIVTVLRDRGYIDHHQGIRRDRIRLAGGYTELAATLGVSGRQIERWLPPLAEMCRRQTAATPDSSWARHQAKRELVRHFLAKEGIVDWSGNGGSEYEFQVQLEDPLTPEHQEIYDQLEELLHENLVTGDPAPVQQVVNGLAAHQVRVSHNHNRTWSANDTGASSTGPRPAQPAAHLVREPHTPRSAIRTAEASLDPRSARLKALLIKHVNPKALKEIQQRLHQHLAEMQLASDPPAENPGVGEAPDLVWDWDKLLGYSGVPEKVRTEIKNSPELQQQFLGQVLYGYAHRATDGGSGIQAPFKFAASRRHDCPAPEYLELAALPPHELAELLGDGYDHGQVWSFSEPTRTVLGMLRKQDFQAVIANATVTRHP